MSAFRSILTLSGSGTPANRMGGRLRRTERLSSFKVHILAVSIWADSMLSRLTVFPFLGWNRRVSPCAAQAACLPRAGRLPERQRLAGGQSARSPGRARADRSRDRRTGSVQCSRQFGGDGTPGLPRSRPARHSQRMGYRLSILLTGNAKPRQVVALPLRLDPSSETFFSSAGTPGRTAHCIGFKGFAYGDGCKLARTRELLPLGKQLVCMVSCCLGE
jgi:hypothetical protein